MRSTPGAMFSLSASDGGFELQEIPGAETALKSVPPLMPLLRSCLLTAQVVSTLSGGSGQEGADGCLVFCCSRYTGLVIIVLSSSAALAQTREEWVAQAVSVQGSIESHNGDETWWQPVKVNDTFRPGDKIRMLDKSRTDVARLDQ